MFICYFFNNNREKMYMTIYCVCEFQNGALILFASDDFFGVAENLLQVSDYVGGNYKKCNNQIIYIYSFLFEIH